MTPKDRQKMRSGAQRRSIVTPFSLGAGDKLIDSKYYVEGYAARFEPYLLYEDYDGPVYEAFDRDCFVGADMSDIIMLYNHEGRVLARTSNGTLIVTVDDNGLHIAADLSKTEAARQMYDEIQAGMVTKMSWAFSAGEYEWIEETRTIQHHTVRKVWDVSGVSCPANDNTEINARAFGDGVIAEAARSEAELDYTRRRLRLKIQLNKENHK